MTFAEISTERLEPPILFRGQRRSPVDDRYNCVAWAFGRSDRDWWPDVWRVPGRWPVDLPECEVQNVAAFELKAFEDLFFQEGWASTGSCNTAASYEPGYEKIALFVRRTPDGPRPMHLARMVIDPLEYGADVLGAWTSKICDDIDAVHDLRSLEGNGVDKLGEIFAIYRKPAKPLLPAP
jgi:hypothetical protein